jgi:hypothetical protein
MHDLSVGDKVRVECDDVAAFKPGQTKVITGEIVSLFNALDVSGDSWHIEIKGPRGEWFLYKPNIDGGKITVLKKA